MSSPPPYPASEFDRILEGLSRLDIGEIPPSSPSPPTALYRYTSPARSGYTHDWDEAAEATQGVAQGHSIRLATPTTPTRKRRNGKKNGYAVFYGTVPGAYATWQEVKPLVDSISHSLYQGYASLAAAHAAFDYAARRSWTRVCGAPSSPPPGTAPIPSLPEPVGMLERPNPLHGGDGASERGRRWYVVYSGITPGVYQSSLECSLNIVGLSCPVFDSWDSKALAIAKFQQAVAENRVHVRQPPYL
ncbi:hypothetical protein C8F04DRAFT_1265720 [Mycena alexandri]|uniref:Ribonuclease H1 N-terminal domain-containing protein n=1 Tax=Mycena alexandri TaxID=1745969 RepID=A0AAD6WZ14_9AGAR|nr:hypothetical protein C8F04DRAFT_1265720 [Mycena alexandri]